MRWGVKGTRKEIIKAVAEDLRAAGVREIILDTEARQFLEFLTNNDEGSDKGTGLNGERLEVERCRRCPLGEQRTHAVFGDGNVGADIMFVGEAPGAEEDKQGLPFVGRAGKLLDRLLEQAGLRRKDVYICNVLKCRPPENRDPLPEEITACRPFLDRQISFIKPKVIVCLGLYAAQTLLNSKESMVRLRSGRYKIGDIVAIPTYHTAAALRFPAFKQQIYDDICRARDVVFGD